MLNYFTTVSHPFGTMLDYFMILLSILEILSDILLQLTGWKAAHGSIERHTGRRRLELGRTGVAGHWVAQSVVGLLDLGGPSPYMMNSAAQYTYIHIYIDKYMYIRVYIYMLYIT
jgi:hypothetical protein